MNFVLVPLTKQLLFILLDENGVVVAAQIYTAGTETTATALQWALLFMCLCPEVKEKAQKEIDEQIGNDNSFGTSRKKRVKMCL